MDLRLDIECAWFEFAGADRDVIYDLLLEGNVLPSSRESVAVKGPLTESALVEKILHNGRPISWKEAVENLRTIRRGNEPYERMWYRLGAGYHPFHLILFGVKSSASGALDEL